MFRVWLTHMKTTIDIADMLFSRTKQLAQRKETTFRKIIEQALRDFLSKSEQESKKVTEIEIVTFKGKGLATGLSWDNWNEIREMSNDRNRY